MKNILLVEDDEALRSIITDVLIYEGHSVVEATNGSEAKEIMEQQKFDLAIVDINMPNMSGSELFAWARDKFHTPFIVMSGFVEIEDRKKAELLGIRHYLSKPFNDKELLDAVKSIFKP